MSSSSEAMLNQGLFEEQEMPTHMGFFTAFPQNLTSCPPLMACHQSLKAFNITAAAADALPNSYPNLSETLISSLTSQKHRQHLASEFGGPQVLSLQRSSANFWTWGEVNECLGSKKMGVEQGHLGVSAMKMKRIKARRKVREPRFCFKTMSDVDVLDDGYKWRKYGQKVVKNTQHPRSYYRCTQDNCRVKKRVERLAEDPRMVITTYEGRHVHSPSHDLDDSQPPNSQLNSLFW
ncbi:putative WRKY transcription factor 12 [Hibiscus syriacus]|uniref:WRKY transcription factor 12 n=1 Tax=Hibiscus syriacus TaxID=106335 RepID=A0A6A2XVK4_HIBSY|nr:probable WRKY transcription factor 13 [Hibiscus syriacus]KAE8670815.1 putative WRKY transcription factor 12 [Hibiscus syriacus]